MICHPKMGIGWQMEVKYLICHPIGVRRTVAWLVETELGGKYEGQDVWGLAVLYYRFNCMVIIHTNEAVAKFFGQCIVVGRDNQCFSGRL